MAETPNNQNYSNPVWSTPRSVLFVPSHLIALTDKAAKSDADAVCLDLEDGVPNDRKDVGRGYLLTSLERLVEQGKLGIVRINSELEYVAFDLSQIPSTCAAVVLPKTQGLQHIESLGNALDRLFGHYASSASPLETNGPGIIAMFESAAAIQHLSQDTAIRAHDRLVALAVGTEDLAADLSCEPDTGLISHAFDELALSANRLGVDLLGFPDSIAQFRDLQQFEKGVRRGKRSGACGAFCIHPRQVQVLNTVFEPDELTVRWAKRVVEVYEQQGASGAISVEGKMIDPPVYRRAKRLVEHSPLILENDDTSLDL